MNRQDRERHLAQAVIQAAANELKRSKESRDVLVQFRDALSTSRSEAVMVATMGLILPDDDEAALSESLGLLNALENALDDVLDTELASRDV